MRRVIMPLLALVALLFSNLLMVPDVHAEQGETFAHAADHVYAHGTEHFDADFPDDGQNQQDHTGAHHHNCSFNLSETGDLASNALLHREKLKRPLRVAALASRMPSVPQQPPKA